MKVSRTKRNQIVKELCDLVDLNDFRKAGELLSENRWIRVATRKSDCDWHGLFVHKRKTNLPKSPKRKTPPKINPVLVPRGTQFDREVLFAAMCGVSYITSAEDPDYRLINRFLDGHKFSRENLPKLNIWFEKAVSLLKTIDSVRGRHAREIQERMGIYDFIEGQEKVTSQVTEE